MGGHCVLPNLFLSLFSALFALPHMPPSEREGDRRVHAVVEGACESEVLYYLRHPRTKKRF